MGDKLEEEYVNQEGITKPYSEKNEFDIEVYVEDEIGGIIETVLIFGVPIDWRGILINQLR